jgi:uncharacterized protein YpbB
LCYVVMSTVKKIHGKRGRTSLVKLLKGSHQYGIERMVQEFDLSPFWGVFFRLDQQEIEDILSSLIEKGFVYIEDVSSGGFNYPMLHISDEGCKVLLALESTESPRLKEFSKQALEQRRYLEISDRGILLDSFLSDLTGLLQLCRDSAFQGLDLTELLNGMNLAFAATERLEKFIYRSTPDKRKDNFRSRHTLDITCSYLTKQLRELLGGLPELEAMVFRHHYQVQDFMQKPLNDILKYYSLMEKDVPGIFKRIISRFSNRSYMERFSFVRTVMEYLTDYMGDDAVHPEPLVKDTVQVTYELYKEGMPITAIAKERGLTLSTIYTHFARLIPQYKLSLDDIIPKDRVADILQAADATGGVSLKAIKEQLAPDYNYGEIKLVMELQKGWKAA